MTASIDRLPAYLRKYCVEQDYNAYTAKDHAAWRFIMRQNREFFRKHALEIYEQGLEATGIPIDRIPSIAEMDEKLSKFGWGAVPVSGFIPGAAFLEFQARGILAIACDMRTADHIEYTPAPDIVHEAAGHAPIIAESAYAAYLRKYAKMAQKAIFSSEDIAVYEAIRYLSDIKEKPETSAEEIAKAEAAFQTAANSISHVSEAAKVGRMAWWTVEYGLLGDMKQPKIYGAGLLSSVGESQNCLSDKVKKIPLTVECVETSFDITKPQPQLFVADDMNALSSVLQDLEATMSFNHGGQKALEKALESKSVNTIVLESGIQISGELEKYERHPQDEMCVDFFKVTGPAQLAYEDTELLGQGRNRHTHGYSTPLGNWKAYPNRCASDLTEADLRKIGLQRYKNGILEFCNGFKVSGMLKNIFYREGKLLYMTWCDCSVTKGSSTYFEPSWGEFDLVVGSKVVSVFGGPADRAAYGEYNVGKATTSPGRSTPYSEQEFQIFVLFEQIAKLRKQDRSVVEKELAEIAQKTQTQFPKEWLLVLEIVELAEQKLDQDLNTLDWYQNFHKSTLEKAQQFNREEQKLLEKGLKIASVH